MTKRPRRNHGPVFHRSAPTNLNRLPLHVQTLRYTGFMGDKDKSYKLLFSHAHIIPEFHNLQEMHAMLSETKSLAGTMDGQRTRGKSGANSIDLISKITELTCEQIENLTANTPENFLTIFKKSLSGS